MNSTLRQAHREASAVNRHKPHDLYLLHDKIMKRRQLKRARTNRTTRADTTHRHTNENKGVSEPVCKLAQCSSRQSCSSQLGIVSWLTLEGQFTASTLGSDGESVLSHSSILRANKSTSRLASELSWRTRKTLRPTVVAISVSISCEDRSSWPSQVEGGDSGFEGLRLVPSTTCTMRPPASLACSWCHLNA